MPTHSDRTYEVKQIEMLVERSYSDFTRAFESLLGRMPVEPLGDLPSLSPQAAREKLASFVGPLDFTLFEAVAGNRVRVTYDRPSSLMAPLGSAEVDAVAQGLDRKVERILAAASRVAMAET